MTAATREAPVIALDDVAEAPPTRAPLNTRSRPPLQHSQKVDAAAVLGIVVLATVLTSTNVLGAPGYADDEGIYTAQAESVLTGSLAPYTYWYDHPPFGWIQLAVLGGLAQLFGLGGGTDIGAMRAVIGLYFVASAVLIYLIARRIRVRPAIAIVGSALFVLSPLSLSTGRQVYLDCVSMPWLLLAFYLALAPRKQLWSYAGAGASFAVAVLSKLTAAVMGPALLFALLDRKRWMGRSFSVVAFLSIGALLLAFFPLMAALRGELFAGPGHVSLQDGLTFQFASRAGSGFIWEPGSARFELVASWLSTDAIMPVAGIVGAIVCAVSRRTRWLSVAVVSFLLPLVVGSGYLPAMYIIGGTPFLCLAIAAAVDTLLRVAFRAWRSLRGPVAAPGGSVVAAVLAAVLVLTPSVVWANHTSALLTSNQNAEWRATLDWVSQNVPRDDVILVPFSMWQELKNAGWEGPWTLIALEKVDLDSDFDAHHPGGWRDIDWIVEGPTVEPNLRYLDLSDASAAFDASTVVESFGDWNVRVVEAGR